MLATTSGKNLRQYKNSLYLIEQEILALTSSPNMVGEVKNLSPNFKLIAY